MGGRFAPALALALGVSILGPPASAGPNNQPATYELQMEGENHGTAANGDTVEVTCENRPVDPDTGGHVCGTFSAHPKALPDPPSGEFVHRDSAGNVLGGGTWVATELLSFDLYGCGVLTFTDPDTPLPPDFCGGAVELRTLLTTGGGTFDAVLTVFCIIGEHAPASHDDPSGEGVTFKIPGVINFNHTAGGENLYRQQ